jgi:AAA+ superfamily predicted ATPase
MSEETPDLTETEEAVEEAPMEVTDDDIEEIVVESVNTPANPQLLTDAVGNVDTPIEIAFATAKAVVTANKKTAEAAKKPKAKRKKVIRRFKVLEKGTLGQALSAKPNSRWLRDLNDWNYRMFDWEQRASIEKAARKDTIVKDMLPVTVSMQQILAAVNMHGPVHIDTMLQALKMVDADIYEIFANWRENIYEKHIKEIIEENKEFEFPFLVHILNKYASTTINHDPYDSYSSPVVASDTTATMPIMFLGKEDSQGFRTPVKFISAQERHSFFGSAVVCSVQIYRWIGDSLRGITTERAVPIWSGMKTLSELGIQFEVNDKECEVLADLGRKVLKLNQKPSYVFCDGVMENKTWWSWRKSPARGRAMIDQPGMTLIDPESARSTSDDGNVDNNAVIDTSSFTNKELALIDPHLYGFSLVTKQWGRFHAKDITEIDFRMDAFDQLVIDEDDKRLILSLVKHVDPSKVTDFIDGKGGGCTMLFHGKPGLGKTLTAEAVAETVKRPLYAASVGELGTNVSDLEDNLNKILQLAARWNAVLLLDEADIFLEERSEGDIHRNAMVGTFLRLLEYYNGILILTSNRVKAIDKAFYSRISFARKYVDHTTDVRYQIVLNLLKVNDLALPIDEIRMLADHDVNGRQLKNSIRLARFLAESENRAVSGKDVADILCRVQKFSRELTELQ